MWDRPLVFGLGVQQKSRRGEESRAPNAAMPTALPATSFSVTVRQMNVRFARCGERTVVSCTCWRGSRGLDCAHPWRILAGDPGLVDLGSLPDAARARQFVAGTALEAELERRHAGGRHRLGHNHHDPLGRGEGNTNLGMGSCLLEEAP